MMRKQTGIIRNKNNLLNDIRIKLQKKKTRFQPIASNDQSFEIETPNGPTEHTLTKSTLSLDSDDQSCKSVYEEARHKLGKVNEIRKFNIKLEKKITVQAKARLSSFKQKQNERYDENISKLASQATNLLLESEKLLKQMKTIEARNHNDKRLIDNMGQSLALEIREVSRNLRQQEKQYFDTIKSYEKSTKNSAIELSQQEKERMKYDEENMEIMKQDSQTDLKIQELVKNINKLSTLYKDLNNIVIEQGSIVDRIDINIDATHTHTVAAVAHLVSADQHASSHFADKIMKMLVIMILILGVILGLKWMA